jgi:hypothetical protein
LAAAAAAAPPPLLPPTAADSISCRSVAEEDLPDLVSGLVSVWQTLSRISGELRVTAPTLLPMLDSCSCRPLLPPPRRLPATAAPPPAQMPLLRLLPLVSRCSASMSAREGLSMSSRVLSVGSTREHLLVTSCGRQHGSMEMF